MTLDIRPATPADLPLIAQFIRDLAEYEKLAHEVRFDEAKLGEKLFGPRPYAEVVIGDSMGEMLAYYAASTATIMGGTLGGTGGQNLIEPCALGVPVILGPSVFNFQQAADEALAAGAALAVQDAVTALDAVATLLDAPQVRSKAADAARQFVAAHRGATARTLDLLQLTP